MEKKQYLKPETSVCRLETFGFLAQSLPFSDKEVPGGGGFEGISNEDLFTDIWGNE